MSILCRFFFLGFFLPLILCFIMYFGTTSNYTSGVFNAESFSEQYDHGIYKYRVLGKETLLWIKDAIDKGSLPNIQVSEAAIADSSFDSAFYSAYFFNTLIFFILTGLTLCFVFKLNRVSAFEQADMPVMTIVLLIAITQYIIVPYDTLSYFFLALAMLLTTAEKSTYAKTIILVITALLAAYTRETALLIISFYGAFHARKLLAKPFTQLIREKVTFILLCLAFACVYIGLRFQLGFEQGLLQDFRLLKSLNPISMLGVVFVGGFLISLFFTPKVTTEMKVFLLLSLPYIGMILLAGRPQELRLWVPLIMCLFYLKLMPQLNSKDSHSSVV